MKNRTIITALAAKVIVTSFQEAKFGPLHLQFRHRTASLASNLQGTGVEIIFVLLHKQVVGSVIGRCPDGQQVKHGMEDVVLVDDLRQLGI